MLDGAIPLHVQHQLMVESRYLAELSQQIEDAKLRNEQIYLDMKRTFGKWDTEIDKINKTSPYWLKSEQVAQIVVDSLHFLDAKLYNLLAFTVMPNHEHTVFKPLMNELGEYVPISKIMHSWKRYSAVEANRILNRSGKFWQHENYDHFARDANELERIVNYVKNNPVKAGLVKDWRDWPWTYVR
jgi:REP element-mobilizing transposase RayT